MRRRQVRGGRAQTVLCLPEQGSMCHHDAFTNIEFRVRDQEHHVTVILYGTSPHAISLRPLVLYARVVSAFHGSAAGAGIVAAVWHSALPESSCKSCIRRRLSSCFRRRQRGFAARDARGAESSASCSSSLATARRQSRHCCRATATLGRHPLP